MTKWKVNDAALFVPSYSQYFSHVRIVAVDEEGSPLLRYMTGGKVGREHWFNSINRPADPNLPILGDPKLTKIGVYRRRFGFLWWVLVPDGVETFSLLDYFLKFIRS